MEPYALNFSWISALYVQHEEFSAVFMLVLLEGIEKDELVSKA
jgi:hypothetical protein